MSTIVTRSGKGSPLSHVEVDANFTNLNTDKIQSGNTVAALTITSATINGGAVNATTIGASTASTGVFTSLTDSGNLAFTGTGNRITGDFSNGTIASRVGFQSSTTNGNTFLSSIPNGSGTLSGYFAYNSSDTANAAQFGLFVNGTTDAQIRAALTGTGTYLPITMLTGGSEKLRIDTSGNVGIGTSSPTRALTVFTTAATDNNLLLRSGAANAYITFADVGTTDQTGLSVRIGSSGNSLVFNTGGTTERMRIDSSGNLLVGTTSGSNKLEVSNGAADVAVLVKATGANYVTYRMQNTSRDYSMQIRTDQSNAWTLRDETAGANRLLVDTSGIVTMSAYGAGAATFSASGVISSVSDETWKIKDGVPTNPDAMLQKLEAGYWFYNEEKAPIFGKERQLGFYAQNVHEAIGEEAAPTPEEGKPWGYYDRSVLAVAVMSLKNALSTIEELKQRIATLENK
jgi:hypothetical protein